MRDAPQPWHSSRDFYQLEIWRRRAKRQLAASPICALCWARGIVTPATVADHIIPCKGDWHALLTGKLQSLCAPCHSGEKQRIEVRGYDKTIGPDGWPIDPRHPSYRPFDPRPALKQVPQMRAPRWRDHRRRQSPATPNVDR